MAIDTDLNNPDSRLAVKFYSKEMDNEFQSLAEGRPIKFMADFVRIEVPGDRLTIIDTFAKDEDKRRFPVQWAMYQNEKSDGGDQIQGTLLKDWPILNAAQASELKHFKFYTVEQVATASDEQIGSIGMMVGMSPLSFRDKAKAFLANAKDSAVVQQQAEALRQRDDEIAAMKRQLEELAAQIKPKATKAKAEEAA
jgi:hypothetical protein